MTWYAVIDSEGNAVSFGTVIADPLPDGFTAVEVEGQPDKGVRKWDAQTRKMVADVRVPRQTTEEKLDAALSEIGKLKALLEKK